MSTLSVSNKINLVAFFAAVSFFLSTIEFIIPKPLPFLRIGLANLPVIICIRVLKPKHILLLILLKVIGQGLITGTLFSYVFLFSISGSFASGILMIFAGLIPKKYISLIGISIIGAMASNIVQLFLAGLIAFGSSVILIAPPFLITGIITSIMLGIFACIYIKKSSWFKKIIAIEYVD